MASKNSSGLRLLKRAGIVLICCWTICLVIFFCDPVGSRQQADRFYNWMSDKKWNRRPRVFKCREHVNYSWKMIDSVEEYWVHSFLQGIEPLESVADIQPVVDSGKLVLLEPGSGYQLDSMDYSFPFVVPGTKALLDTISTRFQARLSNTNLAGARIIVTSVLRTNNTVALLRKINRNAIRNSAHLHGTTFDLSYANYGFKRPLTSVETEYLQEMLALTLFELRRERKCWVTFEIFQACFHVVTR